MPPISLIVLEETKEEKRHYAKKYNCYYFPSLWNIKKYCGNSRIPLGGKSMIQKLYLG